METPTMRLAGTLPNPGARTPSWPHPIRFAMLSAVWMMLWSLPGPGVAPALAQTESSKKKMIQPVVSKPIASKPEMSKAEVLIGKEVIRVDVADTPSLQSNGLGGRKQLAPNAGMLFTYTEKGRHAFWMRGMLIPIDIIWLDNRRVVHVEHNVPPPPPGTPESKLATYVSTLPANLVLELAAGRAKALGLKIGSQVTFRFNVP